MPYSGFQVRQNTTRDLCSIGIITRGLRPLVIIPVLHTSLVVFCHTWNPLYGIYSFPSPHSLEVTSFVYSPKPEINSISFCSKARGYEEGIKENLEMMPKFYPGWILRLYTDYDIKDQMFGKLCNLACHYPFLDICHVDDLPG